MEYGIKSVVMDEICNLAKLYNIEKIYLFGSRARGDYKERSDIDLAISGGDCTGFSLDVQDITSTLLFFDVVNLDGVVQRELLESIAKEGVCIYEKI